MLDESNLERTNRCAKLCIRHLVSLNRPKAATGRLYVSFDHDTLQNALDEGHEAIKPIIDRLTGPNVPTATSVCGVDAKCAHGVVFQLAEETLCRLADGELVEGIKWDRRALMNLYDAIARERQNAERYHPNTDHTLDFTSVVWFGKHYQFSKTQAACIKVLWESWEQGTPAMRGESIASSVAQAKDAAAVRELPRIFTEHGKRHPAWGAMIVPGGLYKGTYQLQPTDEAKPAQQKTPRKKPRKAPRKG